MLLAKTIVKSSAIAGVGLFADEDIKEGQLVWTYHPNTTLILTQQQLNFLIHSFHKTEATLMEYYLTYGYYIQQVNGILLCLDNARFVNHSDCPNMGCFAEVSQDLQGQCSIALRDIKKGEELTECYKTYDSVNWLDDLCQRYQVYTVDKGVEVDEPCEEMTLV